MPPILLPAAGVNSVLIMNIRGAFLSAWFGAWLLAGCGGGGGSDGGGASAQAARYWQPGMATTWQLQLRGTINTGYEADLYEIDLFDAPQATIDALKSKGRRVVCYFSAGTAENWRSDYSHFAAADMGKTLAAWPGERWLDTRSANVRQIMQSRLDLAKSKACDAVDPDNADAYRNSSGFALDADSQLDYNRFLAAEAHARGLAVGLKNDLAQVAALVTSFDFAINERCFELGECGVYAEFTKRGLPVFNVEYTSKYAGNSGGARDALCQSARASNIRTLVLARLLDDTLRYACD